jgi:hypothetical protein
VNLQALAASAIRAVPAGIKAPIVFTKETPASIDAATGRAAAPVSVSVPCQGVEEAADPKRYAELNLQASELKTVFIIPNVAGTLPELDSSCSWGNRDWTLRQVREVSVDGDVIAASVVIAR